METQNIIDFVNKHGIQWFPIKMNVVEDKKTGGKKKDVDWKFLPYRPNPRDFEDKGAEEIEKRHKFVDAVEHIAIDTRKFIQLDVDEAWALERDEYKEMLKHAPYYLSASKRLPHAFVTTDFEFGNRAILKDNAGDLLKGQWAWVRKDEVVYNPDNDPYSISKDMIENGDKKKKPVEKQTVTTVAKTDVSVKKGACNIDDETLKKILGKLKKPRYDNYTDWTSVVWAVKNITNGSSSGRDLAKEFSERSKKYCENGFQKLWDEARIDDSGVKIGTLLMMLKQDCEKTFAEVMLVLSRSWTPNAEPCHKQLDKQTMNLILTKFHPKNHAIISDALFKMIGDVHKCVFHNGRPEWYIFRNHRWHCDPCGNDLLHYVRGEFCEIMDSVVDLCQQMSTSGGVDDIEKAKYIASKDRIMKVQHEMDDIVYLSKISKAAQLSFGENNLDWYANLDCVSPHLLGFENGVYDLDKYEFRDGRPEDMITFSMGWNYSDEFDETKMEELSAIFRDIYPDVKLQHYVGKMLGDGMHGIQTRDEFYFQTGTGANGKGVNGAFLTSTFGDYIISPHVSLYFENNKSSSAASPDIVKLKGKRYVMMTEPNKNSRIDVGTLKAHTGGDLIQGRALFKEPVEFAPQFIAMIQCNGLPTLSDMDGGVARRTCVIPHTTKFVDEPTLAHERKRVNGLREKIRDGYYNMEYFHMLLMYRQLENVEVPECVKEASNEYIAENDIILSFYTEHCDTSDPESFVSKKDLFEHFQESMGRDTVYKKQKFFKAIKEKGFFEKVRCGIRGFGGITPLYEGIGDDFENPQDCLIDYDDL